ncbi:hypothetical protein L596_023185 [Steinernema carpocapsae]|uniref:Uncharacterized protein n=1 Tax=Steinernema carpocapsae TaxID=34508 RepID=A0A4V6XVU0_STECR|nr:hypothetical protein L596_023185 [Steinernema carpocapsae]
MVIPLVVTVCVIVGVLVLLAIIVAFGCKCRQPNLERQSTISTTAGSLIVPKSYSIIVFLEGEDVWL